MQGIVGIFLKILFEKNKKLKPMDMFKFNERKINFNLFLQ